MSPPDFVPKLFVTYSHANRLLKERLEKHLSEVKKTAHVEIWSDSRIDAGDDWEDRIAQAISEAAIAVLLITADFLDSKFIQEKEVPRLLERRNSEGLRLVPILAKACTWKLVPWLKDMQLRPQDAKPVWRRGGDAERELSLIAVEVDGLTQTAKEALERAAQARLAKEEIERERRATENALAKLVGSGRASIIAASRNDFETAMGIATQMQADTQKTQMERWKILQDAQTRIFQIMQDVTANKAQRQGEGYKRWEKYISSA